MDELEFEPSINAENVGVAVKEKIVPLTGSVSSHAEKIAAERATTWVLGVKGSRKNKLAFWHEP